MSKKREHQVFDRFIANGFAGIFIWDHFWEELDTCDMCVRTKDTKNKTPCGEQFFVQTISRTVQQFATIEGNPIHSHMFF